jgi:hypothetical protein
MIASLPSVFLYRLLSLVLFIQASSSGSSFHFMRSEATTQETRKKSLSLPLTLMNQDISDSNRNVNDYKREYHSWQQTWEILVNCSCILPLFLSLTHFYAFVGKDMNSRWGAKRGSISPNVTCNSLSTRGLLINNHALQVIRVEEQP